MKSRRRSPRSSRPCPTISRARQTRLVLVDDDPTIRAAVTRFVGLHGIRVEAFAHGREALRWLAARPSDLLITDVHMPESDAVEVIRAARRLHRGLAIIAISVVDSFGSNHLKTARLLSATHVLGKPFELRQLFELSQRALGCPLGSAACDEN